MGKQPQPRRERKRQRQRSGLVGGLDQLALRRAPYGELLAGIWADTLARFPLRSGRDARPIVEIGAGTGQLRAWLAPELAARVIHTDPSLPALALLGRGAPSAARAAARAEALPFGAGACAGVIGLCVFDAIHRAGDERAAVAEIARVLAPGGRFVHLLDMATLLDRPIVKLAAADLVPIPNVFSDPALHPWPLDVLLLERAWLSGLIDLVVRARHPLAGELGAFCEVFLARPFDARAATARFEALAADGDRRFALSSELASACRLAMQQGYPTLQPRPFHSGKYLASLLETTFRDSGSFRVELSHILTRSAWWPAARARGARYRSLALGHERVLAQLPARLLDESARAQAAARATAGDADALVEAGAYVFVATRL